MNGSPATDRASAQSPESGVRSAHPLLQACRLTAWIAGRPLWRDVDLRLGAGERLGVSGPSGSGKTVLLRTLAGLEPLQQGELVFRGRTLADWSMPAYRSRVTYLPQRAALREGRVEAALRAPFAFTQHRATAYPSARATQWLGCLGRDERFLQQRCEHLSGGEAQIVALLRALLIEPTVLLLDEPTASLDAGAVAAIETLIAQWLHAGPERACIWTSHDRAQLERTCDRLQLLERRA